MIDGIKYRYFEARYTLSDSMVKTLGDSEPVLEEDKNKDYFDKNSKWGPNGPTCCSILNPSG